MLLFLCQWAHYIILVISLVEVSLHSTSFSPLQFIIYVSNSFNLDSLQEAMSPTISPFSFIQANSKLVRSKTTKNKRNQLLSNEYEIKSTKYMFLFITCMFQLHGNKKSTQSLYFWHAIASTVSMMNSLCCINYKSDDDTMGDVFL